MWVFSVTIPVLLLVTGDYVKAREQWNYVTVRENAHMFWWLYYTTAEGGYTQKPLIMWLQGGPSQSSTGIGNFQEIGPLDVYLNPRESTWVSASSLLFVDNPVGTGYSYTTSRAVFTKDVSQIAKDLLAVLKSFLGQLPDFQTIPFYIFSESYGGKMTAAFSQLLHQSVKSGEINCSFQGFVLGSPFISSIDTILAWAPYLLATSLVDEAGFSRIMNASLVTEAAMKAGLFEIAKVLCFETQTVVNDVTHGVNWYNILTSEEESNRDRTLYWTPYSIEEKHIDQLYQQHVLEMEHPNLRALMNGPIKKKLGIIPQNVTWGGQSSMVFSSLAKDFMKPVITIVDDMLINSNLKVAVYSGQLDLIVNTLGTEAWIKKLKWSGMGEYKNAPREPIKGPNNTILAYEKKYRDFSFYWVLNAGHMVPADAGDTALIMMKKIVNP